MEDDSTLRLHPRVDDEGQAQMTVSLPFKALQQHIDQSNLSTKVMRVDKKPQYIHQNIFLSTIIGGIGGYVMGFVLGSTKGALIGINQPSSLLD